MKCVIETVPIPTYELMDLNGSVLQGTYVHGDFVKADVESQNGAKNGEFPS